MKRVSVAQLLRFAQIGGMADTKSIFSQQFPPNPDSEKLKANNVASYTASFGRLEEECIELGTNLFARHY
jgi:hypothetical protein